MWKVKTMSKDKITNVRAAKPTINVFELSKDKLNAQPYRTILE